MYYPRATFRFFMLACLACGLFAPPTATGKTREEAEIPDTQAAPYCLRVADAAGKPVLAVTLLGDETFALRHIHSVHRSPVLEFLGSGPENTIAVLEGQYADYGAGLPQKAEKGQRLEFTGGKARLTLSGVYLPRLELRVGRVAEHTLLVHGREIALNTLIEPGKTAVFSIRQEECSPKEP